MTKKPLLSEDLINFADIKTMEITMNTESNLKPYTIEELRERIAISERQFAAGQWQDFDEAMDEIEAELAAEEQQSEMAESLWGWSLLIGFHPFLGPEEESLADLPGSYRSIVVNSLNKMIYRIQDDHVLVEDFWDVRREPSDLKGQIIRKR